MKARIKRYALAMCLLFLIVVGIAGLSHVGYVYIYWWKWQIQSSLLFLIIVLGMTIIVWYSLSQLVKKLYHRQLQKKQTIQQFSQFYRYEQSAIIYLLQTQHSQDIKALNHLKHIYDSSVLLKYLMSAYVYAQQQQTQKALQQLKWVPSQLFELQSLQYIALDLAQQHEKSSLKRLLYLQTHRPQPWLQDIKPLYLAKLNKLWAEFAQRFPLTFAQHWQQVATVQWSAVQWQTWLNALANAVQDFPEPLPQQPNAFYPFDIDDVQWQTQMEQHLKPYAHESGVQSAYLHCLIALKQQEYALIYAESCISHYFDEQVLHIWLQQALQQQLYSRIEQQLQQWSVQYPALPSLHYAQCQLILAQHKEQDLLPLLSHYPEHRLMCYLRLKQQLKQDGNETLLHDLECLWANKK